MSEPTVIVSVLKRDRIVVIAALLCITLLAWLYLLDMARDMGSMDVAMGEGASESMDMPMQGEAAGEMAMDMPSDASMDGPMGGAMVMMQIADWTPGYFVMMFLMWAIMMVGMMVPSAAPIVLVYASFSRKNEKASPYLSTGSFLGGYLLVWTGFSLIATLLQWGLDEAALLSPMMVSTSPMLGAGILITAGVYQLSPYKNACLAHCRHPIQYFMAHWRKGRIGALRMGLHHGVFCLGCCWFLMMLLFFGGVMNLLWIAAITLFVLLEKVIPARIPTNKIVAPVLIFLGLYVLMGG